MAKIAETHRRVTDIVNNIKKHSDNPDNGVPQIVNESSNFVVVTYWWGRGNINRNTARPCGDFYEDYIKKINKFIVNLLFTSITKVKSNSDAAQKEFKDLYEETINNIFINLKKDPTKFPTLMDMISKMIKHYMRNVCNYYNIEQKLQDPCRLLFEKNKQEEKSLNPIPDQKDPEELFTSVFNILIDGIIKNKDNLVRFNEIQTEYNSLKETFLKDRANSIRQSDEISTGALAAVREKQIEKTNLQKKLIATLKDKSSGESIFDRLISA